MSTTNFVRDALLDARRERLTDDQRATAELYAAELRSRLHGHGTIHADVVALIEEQAVTMAETGRNDLGLDTASYLTATAEARAQSELENLRARDTARQLLAAEKAGALSVPEPAPLSVFIDENADQETAWLIDGLWPADSRTLLVAAYKAGKTTLTANLIRSLVDGAPFLGRHQVQPGAPLAEPPSVLLIDTEMTPHQLAAWLSDVGIENRDQVEVLSLRGHLSGFNIMDPATRTLWARRIEGARVVILDNMRPVLDALGLDENREAGRFLTAWDELLEEAAASESLIVTHAGHGQERARGDSAIMASNAAIWTLVRDGDETSSPRYFRALGRDVDVPESQLTFNPGDRSLTITGGSRHASAADDRVDAVLDFLERSAGTSLRGIKAAIPGNDKVTAEAVQLATERGLIERRPRTGKGGGYAYFLTETTTETTTEAK